MQKVKTAKWSQKCDIYQKYFHGNLKKLKKKDHFRVDKQFKNIKFLMFFLINFQFLILRPDSYTSPKLLK